MRKSRRGEDVVPLLKILCFFFFSFLEGEVERFLAKGMHPADYALLVYCFVQAIFE